MSPLSALSVLCGLFLPLSLSEHNPLHCVPRKTVLYQNNMKLFREEGFWNYSTMLMREDLGLLLLGAREAVFALDINNISVKKSGVYWNVTEEKQRECTYKGKHAEVECRNYIRTLHTVSDNRMYVCGTNAFSPTCDYMTYSEGQLRLEDKQEEGKGKCPFDPFQRYSSVMVGSDLYSATSINFLGSEPVVLRSSPSALRTEFKSSWLNEPNFVYMNLVPESHNSIEGDDDKVYLFFSENAMEYDFYNKLLVSRVARVCKGDMGGQRTLQRKWTSFLKARLDCSLPGPSLPSIVQDVFLLKNDDWRKSAFYAVFTPQSSSSGMSAVCKYSVADIGDVFDEGKFKTPVTVETSHVKWVMYSGELPVPRPGACINNAMRKQGMKRSLDLPDKTLQFIRDRPLMDEPVRPLTGAPVLVKQGAMLTRIVVDSVLALDGETHPVMFIGTENGFVQKSVNYGGEMFIIQEVQLFQASEPIRILRLSSTKGQLYAGSEYGAVQMPLSDCGRSGSCVDCVLARDPYCVWDRSTARCSPVPSSPAQSQTTMIQSLKDGDISQCPKPERVKPENNTLVPGNNIKLQCQPDSNLAQVRWYFSGQPLHSGDKYYIYPGGLLVLNASAADAGLYACNSVEPGKLRPYTKTVVVYHLQLQPSSSKEDGGSVPSGGDDEATESPENHSTPPPELPTEPQPQTMEPPLPPSPQSDGRLVGLQVAVAVLSIALAALLAWNVYTGRWRGRSISSQSSGAGQVKKPSAEYMPIQIQARTSENKPLGPATPTCNSNNNHSSIGFNGNNREHHFSPGVNVSTMDGFGFIEDESEI